MRKSLLEILACPIDKHSPLELFEINAYPESASEDPSKEKIVLEKQTDLDPMRNNIIVKEGILFCIRCSRFFPIIDEIPILLPDELREREKDLRFLLEWESQIPSKILYGGVPWHIDQKNT